MRLNHIVPLLKESEGVTPQEGRLAKVGEASLQAIAEETILLFTQPMSEKEAQYLDSVAR